MDKVKVQYTLMSNETTLVEKRVIPFSNGTEAMFWEETNCSQCAKCTMDGDEVIVTCELQTAIVGGMFVGYIPLTIAQKIGGKLDEDERFFNLNENCSQKCDI
jgi:hypothetical protein